MSLSSYFDYPAATAAYLTNVSPRYRFLYVANPKVASTTILRTLQVAELSGTENKSTVDPHDRDASPLLKLSDPQLDAHDVCRLGNWFRFTYVRNPFTRIISAYLDKVEGDTWERNRLVPQLGLDPNSRISFLDFLVKVRSQRDDWRDIHWCTQSRLIQLNNISYDFIGRFESFPVSFPLLLRRLKIDVKLFATDDRGRHRTGAGERLAKFLTPRAVSLIREIYEMDFSRFSYGKDPFMSNS